MAERDSNVYTDQAAPEMQEPSKNILQMNVREIRMEIDRNKPVGIESRKIWHTARGFGANNNLMTVQKDMDEEAAVIIGMGCWQDSFTKAEIDTIIQMLETARELL